MQAFYKRFSVIAGFVILLVLLIANTIVIRRQLSVQVENHKWVSHSADVRLELATTESLLKDAETGQRGYLVTGDPQYLTPYNSAITQVEPHVQRLMELTVDNPRQQARVVQLHGLAQQKLKELADTVSLYRAGGADEATDMVLTNRGLHTMDKIRAVLSDMQREETSLELERAEAYGHSVRVTAACIYVASSVAALGLILLAYFVIRDTKLQEEYAAQIKRREEWFRVTLTSIGDAVIATDDQGRVTFINPVAEKLTGHTGARSTGLPVADVFPIYNELTFEPVSNPVRKVMELGRIVGLANHTVLKRTDGTYIPIEDSAAPIRDDSGRLVGVVLVFRDATGERRSQELVRKTEKIAAAARLAATVAHEINNPLEAMGNLIYLAKSRPGVPPEALEDLQHAEEEMARVSHVTKQTLGFYREATTPGTYDPATLVGSVLRLYANKLKVKKIQLESELGECPEMQGWAGELKQVISNLVSNAIDAMGENGKLKVTVSCLQAAERAQVEITVQDDGHGIPPEHRERVFEPFFTTKKEVGTGLGLYVSKQIIARHEGHIEIHSRTDNGGRGTIFRILLPVMTTAHTRAATSA